MTKKSAYQTGAALAIGTALFLLWGILALGVIGREGDRADLMYLVVLCIPTLGAMMSRGKPEGLSTAMVATSVALAAVTAIALLMGKHNDPVTSVMEILGLNSMFIVLFLGSAWLFRRAASVRLTGSLSPHPQDQS